MPSIRSDIAHIFGWFSFFIAIWSTISLFVLIEKKSRKEIGSYKYFLRIYCFYAFSFAIIDWLVQPAIVVDIHGFGYIFYSENRLFDFGYSAAHLIQILYCGCFIASSSFLSLNFIYRYITTCHPYYVHFFRGWSLLIWFFYCLAPFTIWSIVVNQILSPSAEKDSFFNESLQIFEKLDISGRPYVGALCRKISTNNFGDIEWSTMGAFFGLFGFQGLFYGISLVCGMLTYRANLSLFRAAQLSKHLYNLQMQLLKAIVIQAMAPLISVYVPPAIVIGGSMTGIYVGNLGFLIVMSISMYPPLDSLLFLLTIKDYRDALFCNSRIPHLDLNSSVSTGRGNKVGDISIINVREVSIIRNSEIF